MVDKQSNLADSEYTTKNGWVTHMDGYDITPWFLGANEFDLQVDGAFINWGAYNASHIYNFNYTGTGNPIKFLMFDGDSQHLPQLIRDGTETIPVT